MVTLQNTSDIKTLIFNNRVVIVTLFLLSLYLNVQAQDSSSELLDHIEQKVSRIENLIENKEYKQAIVKLDDLKNYTNYLSSDNNRFKINYLRANALYGDDRHEEALKLLLEGIDELNNLELSNFKITYKKLVGEIFRNSKDYRRAKDYFKRALVDSERINDTLNILDLNYHIGYSYQKLSEIDSSIFYYDKVISFPVSNSTGAIISKTFNNLSGIAVLGEDLELAEEFGNKSLEIRIEQKDTLGMVNALVNLSGIKYQNEDYINAEQDYLSALNSIKALKTNRAHGLKAIILLNLAYSNEMQADFRDAYYYLEKATNLNDSLAEANRVQNISEIEAKYNVEKQAAETEREKRKRAQAQALFYGTALAFLALLALGYIFYRNYRLKQQAKLDQVENESQTKIINATIDAKEKERKAIAETLHDSVSALLSSANLHLQATKAQLKQKSPQEITKAQTIVNEASVKIRDLSHELISSVLLKFGLAFAVHDMCQKYSNSELTLHSDDDGIKRYHQDFEIKIHNIIEELINNILKHSKASNATIMLAHKENDMLSVRISDDGVGFNPRQVRGKDGLGLSHIEARIKVMKGVFNIISSKDNGTNIFILVPIQFKEKSASA